MMAEGGGFTRSGSTWRNLEQRASILAEEITRLQDSEDSDESENEDFVSDSDDDSSPHDPFSNLERFTWNFVKPETDSHEREIPDFFGIPGVSPIAEEQIDLLSEDDNELCTYFIDLFLPQEMFSKVAQWTNERANLHNESRPTPSSADWRNVTESEVRKFIGLCFLMGMVNKAKLSDYWSSDPLLATPFFHNEKALSRDRFLEILKFIRFASYSQMEQNDSLKKIRPFMNFVQDVLRNAYIPEKELSVDESLVLFKGRLSFKQYIPSKRSRFGIKLYMCCESESGILLRFAVHSNKAEHDTFAASESLPFSSRIVVHLCQDFLELGYVIVCDNWFCSYDLASFLWKKQTMLLGTIRPNRGIPQELKTHQTKVHETVFMRRGPILVSKFVDKKASGKKTIFMIDTLNTAKTNETTRVSRGNGQQTILKSSSILSYNHMMGGVDRADAMIHSYDCMRKSYRWFVKLALHFAQRLLLNSFCVYKKMGGVKDHQKFILHAIRYLVTTTGRGRRSFSGKSASTFQSSPTVVHFPSRISSAQTAKQKRPSKRCKVCSNNDRRKETRYECGDCDGRPALCLNNCFKKWHQLQQRMSVPPS